jgi:hypothetical protein
VVSKCLGFIGYLFIQPSGENTPHNLLPLAPETVSSLEFYLIEPL